MREHRPPGDRVQHLVQIGFHPRALAGGKDDGGEGRGAVMARASATTTLAISIAAGAQAGAMSRFPFDVVAFDLDGTLADTAPDLTAALNHALGRARPAAGAGRNRCAT